MTESSEGTRKRDLPLSLGNWRQYQKVFGTVTVTSGTANIVGRQTTTSETHPEFFRNRRRVRKAARYGTNSKRQAEAIKRIQAEDNGGPFHTVKHEYWASHPYVHLYTSDGPNRSYEFEGPLAPLTEQALPTSFQWPQPSPYDESSLRAAGATAISLVSPLSPQVGVATALGELRNDGLPLLPGKSVFQALRRRERLVSSLGGEFLNYMFGWKPTISELQDLSKVVKRSSEIIQQLRRDSGRPIRRHFEFPTVTSETTTTEASGANVPLALSPHSAFWSKTSGVRTKTIRKTTRVWFDGCFSYLLDPGDNAVERALYHLRIANALYGVAVTPEVLWELTPWSWAVDWFTNVGDVITNLSNWAISGQTLRYGYVMREERISHIHITSGPVLKGGHPGPFIQVFTTIDKRRVKASPFGFQLDWDGFSNTQLAILAALGISRSGL